MLQIKQSEFITSAVRKDQFPTDNRDEIAFVGRSNVGKSSLINMLTNRKKLARISSTPGKTRLINFFLINNEIYFVDLPGYGFAKVSKEEVKKWGSMIEGYLKERKQLKKILLLIDSRRVPGEEDIMMLNWIMHYRVPFLIVATKVDKIKKSELFKIDARIKKALDINEDIKIAHISTLKRSGIDELLDLIQ